MGSASAPRFHTARPGPVGHVAAHVVTTYTSAQVGSHRIWFLIVPARWTPRQASVLRLAPPPPPHHRFLLSAFVVSCSKLRAPRNTACCANARGSPELQHACSLTDGLRVRIHPLQHHTPRRGICSGTTWEALAARPSLLSLLRAVGGRLRSPVVAERAFLSGMAWPGHISSLRTGSRRYLGTLGWAPARCGHKTPHEGFPRRRALRRSLQEHDERDPPRCLPRLYAQSQMFPRRL